MRISGTTSFALASAAPFAAAATCLVAGASASTAGGRTVIASERGLYFGHPYSRGVDPFDPANTAWADIGADITLRRVHQRSSRRIVSLALEYREGTYATDATRSNPSRRLP